MNITVTSLHSYADAARRLHLGVQAVRRMVAAGTCSRECAHDSPTKRREPYRRVSPTDSRTAPLPALSTFSISACCAVSPPSHNSISRHATRDGGRFFSTRKEDNGAWTSRGQ